MQLSRSGRIAVAGVAAAAALSLTACGGGDDSKETKPARVSTSARAAANLPAVPTTAQLDADFQKALDPSVPTAQKLDMIQGVDADPDLPNRLAEAYRTTGASVVITDVTAFGDTLNAKAKVTLNGQENVADVPFVAENGRWKVQKAWTCQMLTTLGQQSAACA